MQKAKGMPGSASACCLLPFCLSRVAAAQIPAGAPIIVLPFDNPDAGTAPRLDARRRRDPAERDAGRRGRDRRRSRGAPAGVRSSAAARERDAEPRLDDQGRPGGRARRSWSAAPSRCRAIRLVARARVVRLDTRPAAAGRRSARSAVGSVRRVRRARTADPRVVRDRHAARGDRLPPTPQVFELYVKGLVAETPSTALAFLEQALKAAPQFDRARLAIWDLHSEASDHQQRARRGQRDPSREPLLRARAASGDRSR